MKTRAEDMRKKNIENSSDNYFTPFIQKKTIAAIQEKAKIIASSVMNMNTPDGLIFTENNGVARKDLPLWLSEENNRKIRHAGVNRELSCPIFVLFTE